MTTTQITDDIVFDRLPPDDAVVTPLARIGERPEAELVDQLAQIRRELATWPPGLVADPEQRARNLLYLPAVIDLFQLPLEPHVPRIIFDRLQQDIPRDDLVKVLYWIAVHWASGDHSAIDELGVFGLEGRPDDIDQIRNRASIYAVKLLGRLTGQISAP